MAYTQDDLTKISTAIIALANGERVERLRFSNGKEVQYASVSVDKLRELQAEIQRGLSTKPRMVKLVTRKGL